MLRKPDLGEYYTPDWIAERLLNQLGYDGNPDTRILDPACGSGTFLTIAIDRARGFMQENLLDRDPQKRKKCAEKILQNIVGFDLNPLAVIAARTNYLLVFGELIRDVRPIEIPVYICDSILTPVLQKQAQGKQLIQASLFDEEETVDYFYLPTTAGDFIMPKAVLDKKALEKVTNIIEECISSTYKSEEFISRIKMEVDLSSEGAYRLLEELYIKIFELNEKGKNGIWARLLKNSFAPVLQKPFDLIAGNPPWVNWESLAQEWRDLSKQLWLNYGLFSLKGHAARLGGGKKDLSMLFTYACTDFYLKPKGQLGFVITQTLLKSKGAGDGFRRFQLGEKGAYLRVKHVDDMSELQPFEGATNQTAILVLQRDFPTKYPVGYSLWRKIPGGKISLESSLTDASKQASVKQLSAAPVGSNPTAPWLTARPHALRALQNIIEKSDYKAWAGACTWLNSVYWVKILEKRPDGLLIVENLDDVGKIEVPTVQSAIEPDLLYPLIRGRDISRWKATPSIYILLTQDPETRTGWPESRMKTKWPYTYNYLSKFEKELRNRSGYKKFFNPQKDSFWSMYNVGSYLLAPYKVMWRQMISKINTSVTETMEDDNLGLKPSVTQHVVSFVPFEILEEAHYFSALMNTSIVSLISTTCFTGKGFGTPGLMDYVKVHKFQNENQLHKKLSQLSQEAHSLTKKNDIGTITEIEKAIDLTAAELWEIEKKELEAIQRSLKELQ
ncbi:MAG: N-6 DNA methylase [Bacillota bacterium]|nr:N-6 DNA methylase [Bacillota bacterium]